MKCFKIGLLFVALAAFVPVTAQASYDGTVDLDISHCSDCECGIPGSPDYYVPGSVHKFELGVHGSVNSLNALVDCKYEWNQGSTSSTGDVLSTLVSSDGTTAWYKLQDSGRMESEALISASLSYTGFVVDGNTVQEKATGGCTTILSLSDDFWIASTNCNPSLTVKQGNTAQLELFAQHFTLDDPLGTTVDDVTSWIDWSKVRTSGCGVEVTSDGVLNTEHSGAGDFGINIAPGINTPEGVILSSELDAITGTVTEKRRDYLDPSKLNIKVIAKKGTKKIVVKAAIKKVGVEVSIDGKKYSFSPDKNKSGKVTVKLSKKLVKGQSIKITISKGNAIPVIKKLKVK